ncbi:MAG: hypothetical protein C0483_10255 [Pirellula sp.]|nr:hypothetical protein [Pirellula sp.]
MLGCCWHHAHDAIAHAADHPAEVQESGAMTSAIVGQCCRRQLDQPEPVTEAADSADDREHESSVPHQDSCDDRCTFVSTDRIQIDSLRDAFAIGFLAPDVAAQLAGEFVCRRWEIRSALDVVPPLRLHLLHQLLLI